MDWVLYRPWCVYCVNVRSCPIVKRPIPVEFGRFLFWFLFSFNSIPDAMNFNLSTNRLDYTQFMHILHSLSELYSGNSIHRDSLSSRFLKIITDTCDKYEKSQYVLRCSNHV